MKTWFLTILFLSLLTSTIETEVDRPPTNSPIAKTPFFDYLNGQEKWYLNYSEVDFTVTGPPSLSPTPFAPTNIGNREANVATGYHDSNGVLKIYTAYDPSNSSQGSINLYTETGSLIGAIPRVHPQSTELEILPISCGGNLHYLVIYISTSPGGNTSTHDLSYVLVDGISESIVASHTIEDFGAGGGPTSGLAISPAKALKYTLYATDFTNKIKKYIIDPSLCNFGNPADLIQLDDDILNPTSNAVLFTANGSISTTELELSTDGKYLAYGEYRNNRVNVIELDNDGNYLNNNYYNLPSGGSVNGLEFSRDNSKIFVSYSNTSNSGIWYLDDWSGNFIGPITGTSDYGTSHLEMEGLSSIYAAGYFPNTQESRLAKISTGTATFVASYVVPSRLPFMTLDLTNPLYGSNGVFTLPDHIDCPSGLVPAGGNPIIVGGIIHGTGNIDMDNIGLINYGGSDHDSDDEGISIAVGEKAELLINLGQVNGFDYETTFIQPKEGDKAESLVYGNLNGENTLLYGEWHKVIIMNGQLYHEFSIDYSSLGATSNQLSILSPEGETLYSGTIANNQSYYLRPQERADLVLQTNSAKNQYISNVDDIILLPPNNEEEIPVPAGSKILLSPIDPRATIDYLSQVSLTYEGFEGVRLGRERLRLFEQDIPFHGTGEAVLTASQAGQNLVVGEIGETGEDGVRAYFNKGTTTADDYSELVLGKIVTGASAELEFNIGALGKLGSPTSASQVLASTRKTRVAANQYDFSPDFTPIGSSTSNIAVYNGEEMVFSQSVSVGESLRITIPTDATFASMAYLPTNELAFGYAYEGVQEFVINNTSYSGDQLQITGATTQALWAEAFEIRGRGFGTLEIVSANAYSLPGEEPGNFPRPISEPIPCPEQGVFYQVREGNEFVKYNPNTQSYDIIGVNSPKFSVNAIGYNVQDNYIYGINTIDKNLIRIGADGAFQDLGPTGIRETIHTGDFDLNGVLYVTSSNIQNVYRLDISNGGLQSITPLNTANQSTRLRAADFTFNPDDGLFYGLQTGTNQLVSFDPTAPSNDNVTVVGSTGLSCTVGYGASFADVNGDLYFFCNSSGKILRIDPSNPSGAVELDDTGITLNSNDGASCALSGPPPPPPPSTDSLSCCPDLENRITNGDFEEGNAAFESEYTYQAEVAQDAILPGNYGVINSADASTICEQWSIDDHTTDCDGEGNFLVVNGQTGQTGSSIFWSQTIIGLNPEKEYELCAYFKNLQQCCFDVTPTIYVSVDDIRVDTIELDSLGADPCAWQNVNIPIEVTGTSVTINLELDETFIGDGNDFAMDDIALYELAEQELYISTQDQRPNGNPEIMASVNLIDAVDDTLASPECNYRWTIGLVSDLDIAGQTYTPDLTTVAIGDAASIPSWSMTTDFPGYIGTSTLSGSLPGDFDAGMYFIELEVYDCDCFEDTKETKFVGWYPGWGLKTSIPNLDHFKMNAETREQVELLKVSKF